MSSVKEYLIRTVKREGEEKRLYCWRGRTGDCGFIGGDWF
jgi:hypothetical protein